MKNKENMGWSVLAWVALLGAAAVSAGCTRHVSRDIPDDGVTSEVVFPAPDGIVLKEGAFPNKDNLRQIGSGVTKDQLYELIGRPHFREGIAAREWDYLFRFREGDRILTCQYKVIFDREYRGRSFHWSPAGCADLLKESVASVRPEAAKHYELSADALFAFGRADAVDLLPAGRAELARIAGELRDGNRSHRTRVIGHTDEIGGAQDNLILSQRRADTVRQLLIDGGVAADRIVAIGRGESDPIKRCDPLLPRQARIECLQPNRRVEVTVDVTP